MKLLSRMLIGTLLTAATALPVLAQVRQLDMGRSMDANPQVGSGGSNRPIPGFVPINGNDIMTGNVTGLAYFHGRVGTSSPYQFRGALGSSALTDFARRSAGMPLGGGTYTGVTQPYYLPSTTVSTGQGGLYSAPAGSGFDSSLIPRTSVSPVASGAQIRSLDGGVDGQAISRSAGVMPLEAGAPGAVLSSPLFVLRSTEQPIRRPDIGVRAVPTSMPGTVAPVGDSGSPDEKSPPDNPAMIQGGLGAGRDTRITGQSGEIRTALVSENYLKLSDQLKLAQGFGTSDSPDKTTKTTDNTGARTGLDIDPFTGQPRQINRLPSPSGRGDTGMTATRPSGMESNAALTPDRLARLSDSQLQAGSKINPVKITPATETGARVSAYDLMMYRAEKSMVDGKFIDAVEAYQSALASKPEDPLALVGRAHAEMSAGIYAGSELDLKFVFTRKPEMIGVKYDTRVFIPATRQEFVLGDLKSMTVRKETANMASFVYCYICYQTGRKDLLQAELTSWAAREGHDEWQVIAARAWNGK